MRDFVNAAKSAADGPRNVKSQPDRSDGSRAKDVTRSKNNPMSIKAGLKKSKSRFKDGGAGIGGSSAGLKNQSKATVKLDGRSPKRGKGDIKILESSSPPANMVGKTSRPSITQTVDYTRRGQSGNHNSIASLEKRTKLDRTFR